MGPESSDNVVATRRPHTRLAQCDRLPIPSTLGTPQGESLIRIVQATSVAQLEEARELFMEYAAWLDLDLRFQDFDAELAALPGDYAPPRGALLLALDNDSAIGCVGLRPFEWPNTAELSVCTSRLIAAVVGSGFSSQRQRSPWRELSAIDGFGSTRCQAWRQRSTCTNHLDSSRLTPIASILSSAHGIWSWSSMRRTACNYRTHVAGMPNNGIQQTVRPCEMLWAWKSAGANRSSYLKH